MFGRKSKRTQKREAHQKALREGLIFWLPGGSSQINVYLDYCVIRCLGKTKMKEKEREIPFTSIRDVIYTPATVSRMASLQLITKEMPDVKRSYWYAYENNLVVVHPGNEELAQKIRQYILNPKGSDVVPPGVFGPAAQGAQGGAPQGRRGRGPGRAGRQGEAQGGKSRRPGRRGQRIPAITRERKRPGRRCRPGRLSCPGLWPLPDPFQQAVLLLPPDAPPGQEEF